MARKRTRRNPPVERPGKGQSLLTPVDSYVVLDIETTGHDPDENDIIEVAAIKVVDGVVTDKYQSLVLYEYGIPEYIQEQTGITDEMVENAPDLYEVFPVLDAFIGDSVLVVHHGGFVINFIYEIYKHVLYKTFPNDYIDILRWARRLHQDWEDHKLGTMREQLGIETPYLHRALSDAEIIQQVYEILKPQADLIPGTYKRSYNGLKAADITTENTDFDPGHPLYQKVCVFTGTLEKMSRKEAMQEVVDLGGICEDRLTKRTNYLIVGNLEYRANVKDGKSKKLKTAEDYIKKGQDLEILSENVFYSLLEEE